MLKKLVFVAVLFAGIYFACQYFGLRSRIAETDHSANRVKASLNQAYYRKVRNLEQAIGEDPTPDKIGQWRQETENRQHLEQLMSSGSVSSTPTTQATVANLENFRKEDLGGSRWYVQLDARQAWADTGIPVQAGDEVEFVADDQSRVCAVKTPCVGPNGQGGQPHTIARGAPWYPEQFPVQDALYQALVARIGNGQPFQVGEDKKLTIPAGQNGTIRLMSNIRLPDLHLATGGFRLALKVISQ